VRTYEEVFLSNRPKKAIVVHTVQGDHEAKHYRRLSSLDPAKVYTEEFRRGMMPAPDPV
jgi:hypothetical protein